MWLAWARLHHGQRALEEAARGYREVIERSLAPLPAILGLGEVLCLGGDYTDANTWLERGVELAPDDPQAWTNLGVTCGHLGEVERGREAFAQALRLAPEEWVVWQARAEFRARCGDVSGAVEDQAQVVRLAPARAGGWLRLAESLERVGRTAEAQAALERGARLDPNDPRVAALRARLGR